jgi:hypothetical protein
MVADPSRVVVSTDQTTQFQVNHHDFPELRAEGESPRIAAINLIHELESQTDCTGDALHRDPLQNALADVQAFIDQAQ